MWCADGSADAAAGAARDGMREEVREKESKARQAEATVQDLKLQLEDLQVCHTAELKHDDDAQ